MKNIRLFGFLIVIVIGIAAGLLYGWLKPVGVADTSLESLRADYKADYVLMVAEVFAADGDLGQAVSFLNQLDRQDPVAPVKQGLIIGSQMGYSLSELRYMADLEKALNELNPRSSSK